MTINTDDVIKAFDSFGDNVVHNQALQAKLRESGFEIDEIVTEINKAIEKGIFHSNNIGEIKKC